MSFLIALLLALADDKPGLRTRVFPAVSIAGPTGCSEVLLTAEIVGPEVEGWYCPAIEWTFPDGTRASEESDCAPFDEREEYPRLWRRRVCAPAHPHGLEWTVEVRLSRSGKTIARAEQKFIVK
jgi:hypothetical protein